MACTKPELEERPMWKSLKELRWSVLVFLVALGAAVSPGTAAGQGGGEMPGGDPQNCADLNQYASGCYQQCPTQNACPSPLPHPTLGGAQCELSQQMCEVCMLGPFSKIYCTYQIG
jgi:hypothetical protein